MHRGTTRDASSTSSAVEYVGYSERSPFKTQKHHLQMCTAQSEPKHRISTLDPFPHRAHSSPRLQKSTVTCAIKHEVPVLLQPPLLTTSANTACAGFLGASTQSGIKVMTKPPICPNREMVSSIGSTLAPQVFRKIVRTRRASMMRVYCQLGKVKLGLVTSIKTSIRVATTKTLLATLASQLNVDIQPTQRLAQILTTRNSWIKRNRPAA